MDTQTLFKQLSFPVHLRWQSHLNVYFFLAKTKVCVKHERSQRMLFIISPRDIKLCFHGEGILSQSEIIFFNPIHQLVSAGVDDMVF